MAKINLPNPNNTSLDPFKAEKEILNQLNIKPTQAVNPYVGMGDSQLADTFSGASLREGFSLLGDEQKALETQLDLDIADQSVLGNVAKGVGRTIGKGLTEILKTPGYVGGLAMAANNELLGEGKNSMSLAVDNAWINAFESLDQNIKDFMPVHIQQEVQDGGLWDKMTDSGWWATTGADGVGFMLSMFAPGAALKAMGVGKGAAVAAEILANSKVGKGIRSLGKFTTASEELFDTIGLYRYNTNLARNLDGVASAIVNTTIEAAAEAAGTFDNNYKELKEKVKAGEMSDEKAREIAGQKASSVFKSNLALKDLLKLLDNKPIEAPVKGSFQWWCPDVVVITTNVSPWNWYKYSDRDYERQALFRRLKTGGCYKFEKNADAIPTPVEIDIEDQLAFGPVEQQTFGRTQPKFKSPMESYFEMKLKQMQATPMMGLIQTPSKKIQQVDAQGYYATVPDIPRIQVTDEPTQLDL